MGQCAGGTIYDIATDKLLYASQEEMIEDAYFMNERHDLITMGGGGGGVGNGTTGGVSYTGGTMNPSSANSGDPDINYTNGDYMYPFVANFTTTIQTQFEDGNNGYGWEVGSCVGHAFALAVEVLEFKKRGIQYFFSYGWVYGNRDNFATTAYKDGEGMYMEDAGYAMTSIGTCFKSTLPIAWVYHKYAEASTWSDWTQYGGGYSPNLDNYALVQQRYNVDTLNECSHFKFGSYSNLGETNNATLKSYITQYGCGLLSLGDTKEMWNAETNDGIVVYNVTTVLNHEAHAMCVRGWKNIAGLDYWICQNSWQQGWSNTLGHHGFFFVPFNYPHITQLIAVTPYLPYDNFAWSNTIAIGATANITAHDWNKLQDRVMGKQHNIGVGAATTFTYTKRGDSLTALAFNQMNSNINQMGNTEITMKAIGNPVSASNLNTLVSTINSI